ncbi:glycosyltransferase family 39 protein [Streptomyces sp. NPDC020330]|uniref:glycosyltransferase family 39 protein n=1 Tax=unclassified Streptomyces TaxID=2593676 RepID=UPI00379CF00B
MRQQFLLPSRRKIPGFIVRPVALSIILGLWGIRRDETVWHDEAATLNLASRSLADLWSTLGNVDAVHGLYYLLMHGLFGLFGADLLVLRLPSVLATAVAAAGVAALGARLSGVRVGLLAGLIFTVLPDIQKYSQEGRSYALVCALVVWATYFLVLAVHRHQNSKLSANGAPVKMWVIYGVLMLTACLLHEFAALALVAHAAALPVSVRRLWACTACAVAAGLAPLAVIGLKQSGQVAWIDDVSRGEYASFAILAASSIALSKFAAPVHPAEYPPEKHLSLQSIALPLAILPTALLMLLSLHKPLYLERYVLYGLVALALLIGAVLDRALQHGQALRLTAVTAALVAAALVVPDSIELRTSESRSDNVTALAAVLSKEAGPGDGVLYLSVKRRAWTLAYPPGDTHGSDLAQALTPVASHSLYGTELPPHRIRANMLSTSRILVVTEPPGAPHVSTVGDSWKKETLALHFNKCRTIRVNGAQIIIYEASARC